MEKYDLHALVCKGCVLCENLRGIYGFPQACILAYTLLLQDPCPFWLRSDTPPLATQNAPHFLLPLHRKHAKQFLAALHIQYEVTTDWTGSTYLGITLKWDYINGTCDLSMPGYITTALHCFQHPLPDQPEHLPHCHTEIRYRAPIQFSTMDDTSHLLDSNIITCVQHIVGTLIHYGRAVNNTMLFALSYIVAAQIKSTNKIALDLKKI